MRSQRESAHSPIIAEVQKALGELSEEKAKVEKKLKEAGEKEKKLQGDYENLKKEVERAKDSDNSAQIAVFRIMSEENDWRAKLNMLSLREEGLKADEAAFKRDLTELSHLVGADLLTYPHLSTPGVDKEERSGQVERKRTVEKLKIRFEDVSVAGGEEMLKEFRETSERDAFLERELTDLGKSAESLKSLIADLETRLATEFDLGLTNINKEFEKLFAKMFDGGEAELALIKEKKAKKSIDGEDVTDAEEGLPSEASAEEGLEIKVSLPRKKVRSLMMLSGGERALTSIALIFAISAVNPPPFIILDETDAALDEANSRKYGDLVEILAKYSQLILITHNRETMSRAGVIYGVTMSSNGISKVLSISFDEASEVAK